MKLFVDFSHLIVFEVYHSGGNIPYILLSAVLLIEAFANSQNLQPEKLTIMQFFGVTRRGHRLSFVFEGLHVRRNLSCLSPFCGAFHNTS